MPKASKRSPWQKSPKAVLSLVLSAPSVQIRTISRAAVICKSWRRLVQSMQWRQSIMMLIMFLQKHQQPNEEGVVEDFRPFSRVLRRILGVETERSPIQCDVFVVDGAPVKKEACFWRWLARHSNGIASIAIDVAQVPACSPDPRISQALQHLARSLRFGQHGTLPIVKLTISTDDTGHTLKAVAQAIQQWDQYIDEERGEQPSAMWELASLHCSPRWTSAHMASLQAIEHVTGQVVPLSLDLADDDPRGLDLPTIADRLQSLTLACPDSVLECSPAWPAATISCLSSCTRLQTLHLRCFAAADSVLDLSAAQGLTHLSLRDVLVREVVLPEGLRVLSLTSAPELNNMRQVVFSAKDTRQVTLRRAYLDPRTALNPTLATCACIQSVDLVLPVPSAAVAVAAAVAGFRGLQRLVLMAANDGTHRSVAAFAGLPDVKHVGLIVEPHEAESAETLHLVRWLPALQHLRVTYAYSSKPRMLPRLAAVCHSASVNLHVCAARRPDENDVRTC